METAEAMSSRGVVVYEVEDTSVIAEFTVTLVEEE